MGQTYYYTLIDCLVLLLTGNRLPLLCDAIEVSVAKESSLDRQTDRQTDRQPLLKDVRVEIF